MSDPGSGAPHLLIVDDDARIRQLLQKYLMRQGYVVSTARDAAHARRLLEVFEFDLLIVDVMMPGETGLEFTGSLKGQDAPPVLMLTARGETDARIEGLEAGADDYLTKPFEPRELQLRVEVILRRRGNRSKKETPQSLLLGPLRYNISRGELWEGEQHIKLTSSESALMRFLAEHPHEPLSRADIATALSGPDEVMQDRAVDVQVTRLRKKIEADPKAPRYLQTVRGSGYMLAPD